MPELRVAARAVVLDPRDRILLVFFRNPYTGESWWATPGGALAAGETHEEALRRELTEETGISAPLGPCVWRREHVFEWGERLVRQVERYFLVRVDSDRVMPALSTDELAAEDLHELRWWTLEELKTSVEEFAPRRLHGLVQDLLEQGPLDEPIDAGV